MRAVLENESVFMATYADETVLLVVVVTLSLQERNWCWHQIKLANELNRNKIYGHRLY